MDKYDSTAPGDENWENVQIQVHPDIIVLTEKTLIR